MKKTLICVAVGMLVLAVFGTLSASAAPLPPPPGPAPLRMVVAAPPAPARVLHVAHRPARFWLFRPFVFFRVGC